MSDPLQPIHVAILGASGYGAGELLRLLAQHPAARVVCLTSTSAVGQPVESLHPHLRGFFPLTVSRSLDFDELLAGPRAAIISALPHGLSAAALDGALNEIEQRGGAAALERVCAIDLSGDLRLADDALHKRHYPESPLLPARRAAAAYGLPELFRERIARARLVANPGCLATAAILAAAPLVREGFAGTVAIDAKTGSSGSGRTLKETTHHPTRHANFFAYKALAHAHEPEILQAWGDPRGERIAASFVAQSMDVSRGIFATAHLTLPEPTTPEALRRRYENFYAGCPFVRVVDGSPELQSVVGSNFCDVSAVCRGRQVVAMAALDNLVKGMAGAAVQNLNLMCGLPETAGLWTPAVRPV